MPKKVSQEPYKPRREYRYTVKDIADLAGMTTNAVNVAKARGKIDPGDLKSVVSFLTRIIIERRLGGDLFVPTEAIKKRRGMLRSQEKKAKGLLRANRESFLFTLFRSSSVMP
ncbi:MAG: hypothetical protein ABSD38_30975 [Syntrophorhabdales bacterium]|jgi:hypothetical protein